MECTEERKLVVVEATLLRNRGGRRIACPDPCFLSLELTYCIELELGLAEKEYWQEIKKHSVSEKEKEQLLGKLDAAMKENHTLEKENRRLRREVERLKRENEILLKASAFFASRQL